MSRVGAICSAAAAALTLAACAHVDVARAAEGSDASGYRYCLPKTLLAIYPKPNGTLDAKCVQLADQSRQYAVTWWAFMAAATLDVQTDNGMLKQVQWKSDTSSVASEAVQAMGEIEKARIDAQADAAEDAAERRETARSAIAEARVELAEAEAKVEVLEERVKKLEAELAQLIKGGADKEEIADKRDEIKDAQDALTDARQDEAAARAKLEELIRQRNAAKTIANAQYAPPDLNKKKPAGDDIAHGPVFFEVRQDPHDENLLTLVPVEWPASDGRPGDPLQRTFRSYDAPVPPKEPKAPPKKPTKNP